MKASILTAAAVLLSISSISFAASIQSMNKEQITKTMAGKTITTIPLTTLNGQLMNNSFTGFFDKNGTVTGQFANKPENTVQNDQGTWKVKSNGTLCTMWHNWDGGKEVCMHVYKLNNGLVFVNEGNRIETIILDTNIQTGNQMTSTQTAAQ